MTLASAPAAGVHIYKNGLRKLGPPSPGALYGNWRFPVSSRHGPAPLRIETCDGTSYLTGAVDEVAVYPRVLTEAEIVDNYARGRAGV